MKSLQTMKFLAITILVVLLLPTLAVTAPVRSNAVSYNPAPADKFHSPLSAMGLIAVTGARPNVGALSLNQNVPSSSSGVLTIPQNSLRFISDKSYIPQSETTVAVDPKNSMHVVGGVNDARFFFCPSLPAADCPSGFTESLSGFSVSADGGKTLFKSNDIPGIAIVEHNDTSGLNYNGFLVSFGDPSVAATTNGNFFYASLAIDPVTGANGVMLAESNSHLWDSTLCVTSLATPSMNPCWKTHFVFGNLHFTCSMGVCTTPTFEDKELIAVDRSTTSSFIGSVYISWDHFTPTMTSASYLARCTASLSSCTMLAGGTKPPLSGTDSFPAFTTPAVNKNGGVHVTWCNYGTATTFGPVSCRIRSSPAGGNSFGSTTTILSFMGSGTTLPSDSVTQGFATEQFRTFSIPTLAVDTSSVSNNLYFAIQVCTSGRYYAFPGPAPGIAADNPGNCGLSSIIFSRSTNSGASWSTPMTLSKSAVNVQPYITVDPSTGHAFVVYYTTQFDNFNHRIDVVASKSTDGGLTFPQQIRVTSVSDEPNSDPVMYDYTVAAGFGGSFVVPQYGDYFQAMALGGTLWVSFTGNYQSELGTFQADPFLAIVSSV